MPRPGVFDSTQARLPGQQQRDNEFHRVLGTGNVLMLYNMTVYCHASVFVYSKLHLTVENNLFSSSTLVETVDKLQ